MNKAQITVRVNNIGLPRYAAPELFELHERVAEEADIWALGCLIFEVFTERLPHHECSTPSQVMSKLLVERQLPFLDLSGVNHALLSSVDGCFEFDPQRRTCAARLHEVLRQLQGDWCSGSP